MNTGHEAISMAACRLADELPLPTLQVVARLIGGWPTLVAAKSLLVELPQPHHRQLATDFIDRCLIDARSTLRRSHGDAFLTQRTAWVVPQARTRPGASGEE